MPSSTAKRRVVITERDLDVFRGMERTPMTAQQLLKFSHTFAEPFHTLRRSQRRLRELADARLLRSWRYAMPGEGTGPHYYKLTLDSYRMLHGPDAVPPTRRFLHEVKVTQHHHKKSLADFTVHVALAAHRHGVPIVDFRLENSVRIGIGECALYPDQLFALQLSHSVRFNYLVELDNSTEPVRSTSRLDCWENRFRSYFTLASCSPERFKLIIVTTKNSARLPHLLNLSRQLNPNPTYSLVCGIVLDDFLTEDDPLFAPCFRDQHYACCPLLRTFAGHNARPTASSIENLFPAPAAC